MKDPGTSAGIQTTRWTEMPLLLIGENQSRVNFPSLVKKVAFGETRKREGSWLKLFWDCRLCQAIEVERNKDGKIVVETEQLNKITTVGFYGQPSARLAAIWTGKIQILTIAIFWIAFWLVSNEAIRQRQLLQWSIKPALPSLKEMFDDALHAAYEDNNNRPDFLINFDGVHQPDKRILSAQAVRGKLDEKIKEYCGQLDLLTQRGGETVPDRTKSLPLTAGEVTYRVLNTGLNGGSLSDQRDTLYRYLEEIPRFTECALQIPRYLVWFMPSLGFVGTLVGISGAFEEARGMSGSGQAEKSAKLDAILGNLGTAFDTTLVALLASMGIAFIIYLIQYRDLLLTRITASYCTTNVIGKQRADQAVEEGDQVENEGGAER